MVCGMSSRTPGNDERRRSPRFCCTGEAKIIRLPWDGPFLPGRLKDLSLGGCCLALPAGFDCGTLAEIVLRLKPGVFRAVGEIREPRGNSGVGMEFRRMSAGGLQMLQEVIRELARLQAHMDRIKSAREEDQKRLLMEEIKKERLISGLLRGRIPVIGTPLSEQERGLPSSESPRADRTLGDFDEFASLDVFI